MLQDIKFCEKDEKSLYWVAQDFSEESPALETFAIRFKTSEIAQQFKKAAEDAQNGIISVKDLSVSRESSEAPASQQGTTRDELMRILQLAEDFYNYEGEEQVCPAGCLGCKQDSIPPLLATEESFDVLRDALYDETSHSGTGEQVVQTLFGSEKPEPGTTATLSFGSVPSVVGDKQVTVTEASIFAPSDKTSTSLFGGTSATSIFGGSASAGSVFGASSPATTASTSIFAANENTTPESEFGGASSTSVFGGAPSTPLIKSIFDGSPSMGAASVFGGSNNTTSASVFGGNNTPTASVFGGSNTTTASVFGGNNTPTASVFGGSNTTTASVFGGSTVGSLFGGTAAATPSKSIFGGPSVFASITTPQSTSNSVFGGTPSASSFSFSNSSESIKKPEDVSRSLFGSPATTSTGSVFAGNSVFSSASSSALGGKLFSGASTGDDGKGLLCFGDLASTGEKGFSQKSVSDSTAWQAKPLFSSLNTSGKQRNESSDNLHQEDDEHDPHFEPVIPLPDIVEVKTGEENLEVLYTHRCKTFRYEPSTKEWKERGLGDIKILFDPIMNNYRVLQRREQIHKLAIHHYIVPGQKLSPMATSDTAWCWYAQDFSEDSQGSTQQLAARFKTPEIAKVFKDMFEKCVSLATNTTSSVVTTSTVPATTNAGATASRAGPQQELIANYSSSESEEDDDYVDSDILFDRTCFLEKRLGEQWDDLGKSSHLLYYMLTKLFFYPVPNVFFICRCLQ